MNFKEIIKQEWEKEFGTMESSPIAMSIQERICARVWNSALELAAEEATTDTELDECDGQSFEQYVVDKYSILKHKVSVVPEVNFITPVINEQGTDTTEV